MWVVRTWRKGDQQAYGEQRFKDRAIAQQVATDVALEGGCVGEPDECEGKTGWEYLPLSEISEISVYEEKDDECIDKEFEPLRNPCQGTAARAALDNWAAGGESGDEPADGVERGGGAPRSELTGSAASGKGSES